MQLTNALQVTDNELTHVDSPPIQLWKEKTPHLTFHTFYKKSYYKSQLSQE